MFLSIIIPVYNKEDYISDCVDSCLNQDLASDEYEIICVNDGSVDRSLEILNRYQTQHSNLRVITQENGGLSSARNTGLNAATGEYVWFLDADDFIASNCLGTLKEKSQSAENDYIKFGVYHFWDDLSAEEQEKKKAHELKAEYDTSDAYATLAIYRRDFLNQYAIRFDNTIRAYGEDTFFGYYFIRNHPRKLELGVEYPLYYYRHNSVSITTNRSDEAVQKRIQTYSRLAKVIKDDYDNGVLCGADVKKDAANRMMQFYRFAMRDLAKLPVKRIRPIMRDLKAQGMFPLKQPAECTFSCKEFMNEQNGQSPLMNALRFYSTSRAGFACYAFPFQMHNAKVLISRKLRSNQAMNSILNIKNRILHR